MAEARPMFRNEAEFRMTFDVEHSGSEGDNWGDLDEAYREGNPRFDYFVIDNYDRIPDDAWATDYSREGGNGNERHVHDPRVWPILRQAHNSARLRSRMYYADEYYDMLTPPEYQHHLQHKQK